MNTQINNNQAEILFISQFLPYPLDDGLKIRAYHTIDELRKKGHKVTLLSFSYEDNDKEIVEFLERKFEINIITANFVKGAFNNSKILHILFSIFSRYPFYMKSAFKKEFKNVLCKLLNKNTYDLLYIYDRSMILYSINTAGLPIILDSVDSQSLNSWSGFKSSENIFHKLFWFVSYLKSKKIERELYSNFNYVITISDRDAKQLEKMGNTNIVHIPSGINLSDFKPQKLDKIPYSLTFLGAMDAFSNQQAVLFFVEKAYPQIKKKFPSIKFFIVGRNPSKEIIKLDDGNSIFVTGYVNDVCSFIEQSEIIISPLKMASGLQTKILVAMAMNKPIVATEESIGEISKFISKNDILIANNADEFITKISYLLQNKSALNEVGKNSRDIIKNNYSWKSLGDCIDQLIKNIIN